MKTFHFEWGGTADLIVTDIWPDGDAPADPTTDDVIKAMMRSNGWATPKSVCQDWNFELEDIEVRGDGGFRSLARELARVHASGQEQA